MKNDGQLTKNFSVSEFARSKVADQLGIINDPAADCMIPQIKQTAELLQKIRDKYGKPIYISSGYRCPELNDAVGGVWNSDHLSGNAADIYSEDTEELWNCIVEMIKNQEIEVCQLINYKHYKWIHISRLYRNARHKNHIFNKN